MDFGFGFWDVSPPTFATAAAAPTFAAAVKKPGPEAQGTSVEEMRAKLSKVRIGSPSVKAVRKRGKKGRRFFFE